MLDQWELQQDAYEQGWDGEPASEAQGPHSRATAPPAPCWDAFVGHDEQQQDWHEAAQEEQEDARFVTHVADPQARRGGGGGRGGKKRGGDERDDDGGLGGKQPRQERHQHPFAGSHQGHVGPRGGGPGASVARPRTAAAPWPAAAATAQLQASSWGAPSWHGPAPQAQQGQRWQQQQQEDAQRQGHGVPGGWPAADSSSGDWWGTEEAPARPPTRPQQPGGLATESWRQRPSAVGWNSTAAGDHSGVALGGAGGRQPGVGQGLQQPAAAPQGDNAGAGGGRWGAFLAPEDNVAPALQRQPAGASGWGGFAQGHHHGGLVEHDDDDEDDPGFVTAL